VFVNFAYFGYIREGECGTPVIYEHIDSKALIEHQKQVLVSCHGERCVPCFD